MKITYKANEDMSRFGIHFDDMTSKEVDALRHMLQSIFQNTERLFRLNTSKLGDQSFVDFVAKANTSA